MIPVLFASVTHSALQVYLERLTHGQFSESFFSFLPEYFNGVYLEIGMPGNYAYHGMHLWYLLFLFIYGLICYPLFIRFQGSGREILNRVTTLFAIPGLMVLWFSLPLLIIKALIPQAVLSVGSGGWGFLYYLWFLISGCMIVSRDRLQENIKNQRAEPQPRVYIEMHFSAPAGRYIVWLRGKSDIDNGYTDSVWLQVDDQIGTRTGSVRLGNWLDVHPAGVYGWASDTDDPIAVTLKHNGDHKIRIQPRQTPHRIDQIWLSRSQHRIPNTYRPIK
ncbi:MAG: hypothetical protein JRJ85_24440 [Deltaproteobacteria bacterium]|nr:hypothetical protein [Deltaproteobacteria bacterium]